MDLDQMINRISNKTLRSILNLLKVKAEETVTIPEATTRQKGIVKLSGVLTGTSDSPELANEAVKTDNIRDEAVTVEKLPGGRTNSTYLRGDGAWATPVNTTYTAGAGISFVGTEIRNAAPNIIQTISQSGNTITLSNGGGSATFTYTDTVTRVKGGTGNFVSGDVSFVAGSNVSISQSGSTITISSGINTYTGGTNMNLTGSTFSVVNSPTFSGSVTATSFLESSRREFKSNIQVFTKSGLDLINQLEIVTFDRADNDIKNKIGIIIDDTPEEFASMTKNEVDLYKTIFILAKAVQELDLKVTRLENGNIR